MSWQMHFVIYVASLMFTENNEEEDLNKSFWLPKTTKKKKKRVLIDLSYTLGCTREGK